MEGVIKQSYESAVSASTFNSTLEARLNRILLKIKQASENGEWFIRVASIDKDCEEALAHAYFIEKYTYTAAFGQSSDKYVIIYWKKK